MQTVKAMDWLGKEYAVNVQDLQWRPSAYGIIIRNNAILLVKQDNGYDLPGGGVELGETLEQAVIREIQEESGIIAKNPQLLAADTTFFKISDDDETDEFVQSIMLYYACEYNGGELSRAGLDGWEQEHVEGAYWLPLTELDHIKVASTNDYRKHVRSYYENSGN
jgi:8-oxo-dGTP diphosphatase